MTSSDASVWSVRGSFAAERMSFAQAQAEAAVERGGSVLVLCASHRAARAMSDALPHEAHGVRVTTPLRFAKAVLERERGVPVRVLNALDERVLFEDVRPTQIRQSRLKGIVRFLDRGFAELEDEDKNWLSTGEERLVLGMLEDALRFSGGMLASQVAGSALRLLRESEDALFRASYDTVVVCDYHLLSRASQQLARAVARKDFVAVSADAPDLAAEDSYPNFAGVDELSRECSRGKTAHLRRRDGASDVRVRCECFEDVNDELAAIADMAASCVQEGSSTAFAVSDVLVLSPNATWRRACARVLQRRGIPVQLECDEGDVLRDLRYPPDDLEQSVIARLREDAHDSVAWRTWCALGDYLGRSAAVRRLRELESCSSLELAQALDLLIRDELLGMHAHDAVFEGLVDRYRVGLDALRGASPSGEKTDGSFRAVDCGNAVVVCSPRAAHGLRAKTVVLGSCVEGAFPEASEECGRVLLRAKEAARKDVVCTSFKQCDESAAASMGVKVARIRLRDGAKVCETKRCAFLDGIDAQDT